MTSGDPSRLIPPPGVPSGLYPSFGTRIVSRLWNQDCIQALESGIQALEPGLYSGFGIRIVSRPWNQDWCPIRIHGWTLTTIWWFWNWREQIRCSIRIKGVDSQVRFHRSNPPLYSLAGKRPGIIESIKSGLKVSNSLIFETDWFKIWNERSHRGRGSISLFHSLFFFSTLHLSIPLFIFLSP